MDALERESRSMLQVQHSFNDEFVIVLKSESKAGLSVQQQGAPRTAELQFTQAIFQLYASGDEE